MVLQCLVYGWFCYLKQSHFLIIQVKKHLQNITNPPRTQQLRFNSRQEFMTDSTHFENLWATGCSSVPVKFNIL